MKVEREKGWNWGKRTQFRGVLLGALGVGNWWLARMVLFFE